MLLLIMVFLLTHRFAKSEKVYRIGKSLMITLVAGIHRYVLMWPAVPTAAVLVHWNGK